MSRRGALAAAEEVRMSVRHGLLAILDQGACYGYQLRTEFARRTGGTRQLNVGQIYNTLERLERDGLVVRGPSDERGHVYWTITDAGRAEMHAWMATPTPAAERESRAVKLALAATLPGLDAREVVRVERDAVASRLRALQDADRLGEDEPGAVVRALMADAERFATEADARWLAHAEERLSAHPDAALALELSASRPKRGRPARASSPSV